MEAGQRKLFKYYLDQNIAREAAKPLFFRRMYRWRNNSFEYAVPFSKKGIFRGYIKYGVFAYAGYHYTKQMLFGESHHGHGHDDHGHGDGHGKGHH